MLLPQALLAPQESPSPQLPSVLPCKPSKAPYSLATPGLPSPVMVFAWLWQAPFGSWSQEDRRGTEGRGEARGGQPKQGALSGVCLLA